MEKTVRNTSLTTDVWLRHFTRSELRKIAKHFGVRRGKDKGDTAFALAFGIKEGDDNMKFGQVVFPITINIEIE